VRVVRVVLLGNTEGVALIEAIQLFEQQEKQKYRAEEVKRQQRREKRKAAEGQGPVRVATTRAQMSREALTTRHDTRACVW